MDREKLLQNPLPIDRVAARVVRAARPENLWRPMPKTVSTRPPVSAILRTAPLPEISLRGKPELRDLPGKRRGRLVIVGYAADQPVKASSDKPARWVVRCDCGNYEYRIRIFRWIGTAAPDMCRECEVRARRLRGGHEQFDREPAARATVPHEATEL